METDRHTRSSLERLGESSPDETRQQRENRERKLVLNCIWGDQEALTTLFRQYQGAVRAGVGEALSRIDGAVSADVDDLVQRYWQKVVERTNVMLAGFDAERGPLAHFLEMTARQRSLKYLMRSHEVRWPDKLVLTDEELNAVLDRVPAYDPTVVARGFVNYLSDRSRDIISAKFGLPPYVAKEAVQVIARRWALSKSECYRIIARAINRMYKNSQLSDDDDLSL